MCSLLQICVQYCIDVAYVVEIKLNSIQFNSIQFNAPSYFGRTLGLFRLTEISFRGC